MRRFSRRLFGADAREVREFLAETAVELDRAKTALDRAHIERDTLQNRLREVAAEVDRLRGQVAAAQEKIAAHQALEGLTAQVAAERDALVAERDVLRETLGQITAEVDGLRAQMAAAEAEIAALQAREALTAQLAAERDSLQNRLREAAAELHRLREQAAAARTKIAAHEARKNLAAQMAAQRDALRSTLKDLTAEIGGLRAQAAAAQAKIAAYQAEDREIARTLLSAQKAADDLVDSARQEAEDARSAAAADAEAARQAARKAAAETLRRAQARAEATVRAAEEVAATRLARQQVEAEWFTEHARREAAEAERSAERHVADLIARLETFVADGQFLLALRTSADTPAGRDALAHLEREARDGILPALHRLVQTIKDQRAARIVPFPVSPDPAEGEAPAPDAAAHQMVSTLHRLVQVLGGSDAREAAPPPPASDAGPDQGPAPPEQDRVVPLGVRGEIVVSPVRTRYRATKIAEAVARMKGIRAARLRVLQDDTASMEVTTEAGPLVGLDFTVIDGVPMDVVEATDARLVLRVARTPSESVPG